MLQNLIQDLNKVSNPRKAKFSARYFKTGKGEYGEGDVFLGLTSNQIKVVAKKYSNLDLVSLGKLLDSKIHDERTCALRILVDQYEKAKKIKDGHLKKRLDDFYLQNVRRGRVNNWDLVDMSAPKILGDYLLDKNKDILYDLVRSKNLWSRRVVVLSTFAFIRQNKFFDSLKIAKILISDREDLIQKAIGWMLREVGKKNLEVEINFLNKFYQKMPRTTLRYAIEKFNDQDRKKYLA